MLKKLEKIIKMCMCFLSITLISVIHQAFVAYMFFMI